MRTFVRVCAFLIVLCGMLTPFARIGLIPPTWVLSTPATAAEEPAKAAPKGYYPISITGAIGRDFTAGQMQAHLKEAGRFKPAVVLLVIDSGGGDIDHAERIVDLIIAHKDLTFVAYVQKALSAAATITLACEKIFVTESATIGGAVSYSLDEKGNVEELPADVAEKFQSIWRATCRKAAEHGGHPSLIAEAMVDPAFALTMGGTGGNAELERNGEGKVLKAKGRILTLTAREAISCGLAAGLVENVNAVGQQLAVADWQAVGDQEQVGAADLDVPAVLGPEAFATPSRLFSFLYRKFVSLGLTEEQTELQATKAAEEWEQWFGRQRFSGHPVKWNMTLVEAHERRIEVKVVHHGHTYEPGKLGRPISWTTRETRNLVDFLKEEIGSANNDRNRSSQLRRRLQAAQAYPIEVTAKCDSEPRVFPLAWVGRRSKDQLLEVAPGSEIALTGEIRKVTPLLSSHGRFGVEVILDKCELVAPGEEANPASDQEEPDECRGWVQMAKNFLRARRPDKAITYAEKVLEKYADSQYADEARAIREQARQMLNPPPPESEKAESEP